MNPLPAFVIATFLMLLNGGVLGLMHRDLPVALRPSAISWRIGTLLQAGGCVLLAVQDQLPLGFILPVANGMLLLGLTGYWRAVRQFYAKSETWLLLLPMLAGTLGIAWFAGVKPDLSVRVWIASLSWGVILLGCAWSLYVGYRRERAMSGRVLAGIFLVLAAFMLLRGVYFLLAAHPGVSVLDGNSWINLLTPMIAAILPVTGTTAFLLLCSERIRRQWERAASTDYLTGLANRRTIAAAGVQRFVSAQREGRGLAVALIDIDHFKSINDRYGHEVGDAALQHVSTCLEQACRDDDLPGRHGGEEFVAVLALAEVAQAVDAGERLRVAVSTHPFLVNGTAVTITVSIGIATLNGNDPSFEALLRRADHALYAAKSAGRDRVALAQT